MTTRHPVRKLVILLKAISWRLLVGNGGANWKHEGNELSDFSPPSASDFTFDRLTAPLLLPAWRNLLKNRVYQILGE